MAGAKPPRRAEAVGVPADAPLMIADVITPIPTKRFRASQFIPSAMLREAKNRAIVAILLSGRHASAWIEHGSAHRCRDECSSFLAIPRKLSLARNWAAKVRAIISGGRIIVRIGRLAVDALTALSVQRRLRRHANVAYRRRSPAPFPGTSSPTVRRRSWTVAPKTPEFFRRQRFPPRSCR